MKKKYQLKSFVKINRLSTLEVLEEFKKTGELPFKYDGNNWIYDYTEEYLHRFGINNFQFNTSDEIANDFIGSFEHLINWKEDNILDACCGYGQLSKAIIKKAKEFNIDIKLEGFDNSKDVIKLAKYQNFNVKQYNFLYEFSNENKRQEDELSRQYYDIIISNPPFGKVPSCIVDGLKGEMSCYFMEWVFNHLDDNGLLACILPANFWEKNTRQYLELHNKFQLINEYENDKKFYNTKTLTKFFIFKKLK